MLGIDDVTVPRLLCSEDDVFCCVSEYIYMDAANERLVNVRENNKHAAL